MATIGTTSVPGVTFGPNGFIAPSGPSVLNGCQLDLNAAFSVTFDYSVETPQAQLAGSTAALVDNVNQIFTYYTQQTDPAYASGRMQDGIARIYFITRLPSVSTTLQVLCTGGPGVVIPQGALVVDANQNLYGAVDGGTISAFGSVTLSFAALVAGPIAVPAALTIYQAIPGWDGGSVSSGLVGQFAEGRAQFEARRQLSVQKNAVSTNNAILGEVLAVTGVLDAYVIDNPTNAPATIGGFTLATRSVYVAVTGGDPDAVAAAIFRKKPPGIPMNGNTTVVVEDQNPAYSPPFPTYSIKFEIPPSLNILFSVNIANSTTVPSDATTQIQNAIIAAFNGNTPPTPRARIGSTIYAAQYAFPIAALGAWASIKQIKVGSNNTAGAVVRGYISATTLTVLSVVSGTLAVGQTISGGDSVGTISDGTTITAFGTGSGGIGTYTINNTQTIAGATFTGNGSGTNLTASAVTGTIGIGDVISGTGVPTGTTIVSQTSGTTGGAGVYVTSGATTSSGAAITAQAIVTATVADQDLVAVGIAQEPAILAANIKVALT